MKCELTAIADKVEIGPGQREGLFYAAFFLKGRAASGDFLLPAPCRSFGEFKIPIPQDFYEAFRNSHPKNQEYKLKITIETVE